MTKHIFSMVAFMMVSFLVQGLSHFVINEEHFAGIDFIRTEPIIPLGLLVMMIQGLILSIALSQFARGNETVKKGIVVSISFGIFLTLYIAIVEPSKYIVPSISAWFLVESIASLLQFSVYGVLLGLIHQRFRSKRSLMYQEQNLTGA